MVLMIAAVVLLTIWQYSLAARKLGVAWVIRNIAVATASGLLSGLLIGLAARAGMRAITLANADMPRFTWSGTAAVVAVFAAFGGIFGIVYAGLFRHLIRHKGWAYGLLLAACSWYPLAQAAAQELTNEPAVGPFIFVSALVVAAMWLPYGVILEVLLSRRQDQRADYLKADPAV